MRRLRTLALVGLLMSVGLPARSAPSATTEITLTGGGSSGLVDVVLYADPGAQTAIVEAEFAADLVAFCGGASAIVHVVWQASATIAVEADRHFRSGSFNGSVLWNPEVVGGCGDFFETMPGSISGTFETVGQASRWREGTTRFVERTGVGLVELGLIETVSQAVEVTVMSAASR